MYVRGVVQLTGVLIDMFVPPSSDTNLILKGFWLLTLLITIITIQIPNPLYPVILLFLVAQEHLDNLKKRK